MQEISKKEVQLLIKNGIIKNTHEGFKSLIAKDQDGRPACVGYYATIKGRHRYIEDSYAKMAKKFVKGEKMTPFKRVKRGGTHY